MKRRFQLITIMCCRCGKPISTGNRSLHGADNAKAKYDRICVDCTTPEEGFEIALAIGQAIVSKAERIAE